jgi:hypothetical protein
MLGIPLPIILLLALCVTDSLGWEAAYVLVSKCATGEDIVTSHGGELLLVLFPYVTTILVLVGLLDDDRAHSAGARLVSHADAGSASDG